MNVNKRIRQLLFLVLTALLLLTSCADYPARDLTGAEWDTSWEMLGTVLGVEEPGNDFTLLENDSVLTGADTFYAAWTTGTPVNWVNEEGKDTDLYPAQIHLLLFGCEDAATAEEAMADFVSREEASYSVTDRTTRTFNGQEYLVLQYTCGSETNPYQRGCTAFAIYENYVVNAEITCTERYDGDASAVLESFLSGCHLAEHENR